MGILARSMGLSQINNPSIPLYAALTAMDDGPPVSAGVTVNQETAMRVVAVNACVKLIAETIAALPLLTFNRGDEARVPVRKPSEAYVWDQPNPEMTMMEFWEQVFGGLLLDGNAFIETVRLRNGSEAIAELWPIEPQAVRVERTNAGQKRYVIEGAGGGTFDNRSILHIPAWRRPGQDRGLSPIASAREAIGVAVASERLAAKFFGSGSVMSGLIETAAVATQEQVDALAARFQKLHAGPDNAFKVGVLDSSATFRQLSIPPEDLQFLESRKFQVAEIARLFQVPPHLIGDVERSTSWGTGIEQQGIGFVTYCLLRWMRRTEQAISKFLLPTRERYARWNAEALLRGDSAARAAMYSAGRQAGWLSINDIRRLEEMEPIADGDDYLQPLNFAPVGSPAAEGSPAPASDVAVLNGARSALAHQ